jgi:hypothetical protein
MTDFERSAKQLTPPTNARSARTGRKVAIYFLSALIVSAMIAWFGFLGWGFVAVIQWLLDGVKYFWTTYL